MHYAPPFGRSHVTRPRSGLDRHPLPAVRYVEPHDTGNRTDLKVPAFGLVDHLLGQIRPVAGQAAEGGSMAHGLFATHSASESDQPKNADPRSLIEISRRCVVFARRVQNDGAEFSFWDRNRR